MSNELNEYYLQQMGIDVWKERKIYSCAGELSQLASQVSSCTRCVLHKSRTNTVFARGNYEARLMIIGEAPGFYEDKQGLPFVGKAGGLLNQMLNSIGLGENEVYIANVIKCRPPDNRDPQSDEIEQCSNYLAEQIRLVAPKLLLALGRFAGQFLVKQNAPLNQLRSKLHYYDQTPCVVTYHPAYLLRKPSDKKKAYTDLLEVRKMLTVL